MELSATDRRLLATPGRHSDVPTSSFVASINFLIDTLGAVRSA